LTILRGGYICPILNFIVEIAEKGVDSCLRRNDSMNNLCVLCGKRLIW
jgi:hypothetical protein